MGLCHEAARLSQLYPSAVQYYDDCTPKRTWYVQPKGVLMNDTSRIIRVGGIKPSNLFSEPVAAVANMVIMRNAQAVSGIMRPGLPKKSQGLWDLELSSGWSLNKLYIAVVGGISGIKVVFPEKMRLKMGRHEWARKGLLQINRLLFWPISQNEENNLVSHIPWDKACVFIGPKESWQCVLFVPYCPAWELVGRRWGCDVMCEKSRCPTITHHMDPQITLSGFSSITWPSLKQHPWRLLHFTFWGYFTRPYVSSFGNRELIPEY